MCFLPPVYFIQFFSSFCFSSPARSPEFLNICWKVDESCRGVLSLFLSLCVSVSFHLSFFCFLLSFLPERKERHRVIGFPLIARVMLTVHKSCHWNSTSFIFRFCLGFLCLFSSSSSSSHLVLQCELSHYASFLSPPPPPLSSPASHRVAWIV